MKLHSFVVVGLLGSLANPVTGTWSIVATDRATGQVGGAGATCRQTDKGSLLDDDYASVPGTGSLVGQACVDENSCGLCCSQHSNAQNYLDPSVGGTGLTPQQILDRTDPYSFLYVTHQWGIVDLQGNADGWTGSGTGIADDVQGHVKGGDYTYAAQGNRLTSVDVVTNVEEGFKSKSGKGKGGKGKGGTGSKFKCDDLADRLMRAVEAGGKDGGGDSDCTPTAPADTAYLVVQDADGNDVIRIEEPTIAGDDALVRLRAQYEAKRGECLKRPKGKDRILPKLKSGEGVIGAASILAAAILLGLLGFVAKKRRTSILHYDENTDNFVQYELETR